MKQTFLILVFLLVPILGVAQSKNFIDQPYLETKASIDTLVTPDRIFLTIILNESDNKNKISTEELEQSMKSVFESLKIDIQKDLTLLDLNSNFKKYFLADQKVLKTKMFSLKVTDAITAGKVFSGLEKVGISNISVEKVEYSQSEKLILILKSKAILKAKSNAENLVTPLGQKVGPAIYISDMNSISNQLQGKISGIRIAGASSDYGSRSNNEPLAIEFNKIEFSASVMVRFTIQ